MIDELRKRLDEKRFKHSLGVAKLAKELAGMYGEDEEKAYVAGILHDCAKNIPFESAIELCESFGIVLDDIEKKNPALIHAPLGAEVAKRDFGLNDEDAYNAIKYHTIGRVGMSNLEKIVYVADMAEENRNYAGVDEVREALNRSLDDGVLTALRFTVRYNMDRFKLLHPETLKVWNSILEDKEKK